MDKTMSTTTRKEVLERLRRRYRKAGREHKCKLLDQAQELLGYHRKSAVRALGAAEVKPVPWINAGRPVSYEPSVLLPWLRPIWQATDYACGRRLVAMLPEWIPAYEVHERRLPAEVREKLLGARARTLDRLPEPVRGQATTLAALQDIEASLPFALLGLDSDNGGEFLNYHVLHWLQKRVRLVFTTRSRPWKKDDNAHVEQKNWTHVRQNFGYERHDNPEVVEPINVLVKGPYGQLLNYCHTSLKLEGKERGEGRLKRIYGPAQTPLARVLASPEVTPQTKRRLQEEKARLNPFALKLEVDRSLKAIAAMRRLRP
jgi:hypothetical protein